MLVKKRHIKTWIRYWRTGIRCWGTGIGLARRMLPRCGGCLNANDDDNSWLKGDFRGGDCITRGRDLEISITDLTKYRGYVFVRRLFVFLKGWLTEVWKIHCFILTLYGDAQGRL